MFHWFDLLLFGGFCIGFTQYHVQDRRRMLGIRIAVTFLFTSYFYASGAYSGAVVAGISCLAVFLQYLVPQDRLAETFWHRNIGACLFAVIGVSLTYQGPADMLPVIAFVICRFGEAQADPQHIRYGLLISVSCWVAYAINLEMWLLAIADTIMVMSNMYAIVKHRKTAALAAARVRA